MNPWISLPYYTFYITLVAIGLTAVGIAVAILKTKSIVYSIYLLAFLGLTTAGYIALLGFQFIGAIHIIIYVGAAVLFFIVSISMIGDVKTKLYNQKELTVMATLLFLLSYYSFKIIVDSLVYSPSTTIVEGKMISNYLLTNYSPQLLIAVFAMATTIIESLILAKKEVGE